MIKFFRKIRQSLLAEGKFAQYLKYAVGEIVLVVIGILIAIQLNGLQNKNLQDERTIVYLTQLLEEVEYNSLRSNYLLDSDSLKMEGGTSVYQQLNRGMMLDSLITLGVAPDKLGLLFHLSSTEYNHPRFQRTVYENGISTGALFKLKRPDVLEHIQLYYTQLKDDERWIMDSKASFRAEQANASDLRVFKIHFERVSPDLRHISFEEEKAYWLNSKLDSIIPLEDLDSMVDMHPWIFNQNSQGHKDLILYTRANILYSHSLKGALSRTIMSSDSLAIQLSNEINALSKN